MTASLKLTPLTPLFYHKKKEIASFFCNKKARDYRLFGLFVRILSLKIYGVNVERRVYYLYNTLDKAIAGSAVADLLVLLSAAGAGALVYAVILYLFKVEEIEWCIKLIKNRISKNKHVIKL
ncbi:MAG: hypothetical protein AB1394_14365 [Bacteroidota bacterium]